MQRPVRPTRRALAALATAAAALGLLLPSAATSSADEPEEPTWAGTVAPMNTPWTTSVGPDNALPEYPRPQLARPTADSPTWTNLNGLWEFQPADGFSALPFGRTLSDEALVPYPIESALSGIQEHSDHMVYRKVVTVPKAWTANGKRVRLNFGAVNHEATVYVNKVAVAHHTGGYDAFSADITAALRPGRQEILVAVDSPLDAENIPVGKQRLNPGGIFYTGASGIWQTVWMEPVQPVSVATLTATPTDNLRAFVVKATTAGDARGATLSVSAYADGRKVATASGNATSSLRLTIPDARTWSPADPFLYTFRATLTKDGVTDRVESYAGMRTIKVEQVAGKQRILLNGKQTFLLGTLDQGYWPDGIHTAPTDEALRFDIEKTKELGFNTIRKHIKVEPARWYYHADQLGMMVWQDAPALPDASGENLSAADKVAFKASVNAMVNQLKGVTSIIGWVPFNEGWGQWSVPAAGELAAQVKAVDPTRLVISRSGSNCCRVPGDDGSGDIIDWHQYQGPALPAPDATRASIDGEHGGLTLGIDGHLWPGNDVNPYGSVEDAEALTEGYVANTSVLRDAGAPYGLSGSIYTQITDVEGEQNGFWTYDREVLKPSDPAAIRQVNLETIAAGSKPAPTPPAGTPGLDGVAHWALDDGAGTTAADSAGDQPLTLDGPTWAGADGLHFAGTASAHTDGTVVPTQGTNFSVSAWARLDRADGAFQTVVSEDGDDNSAFFLQYAGENQRWAFSFVGARAVAQDLGKPEVGRWYHLVGVRDVTDSSMTLYVDGAEAGSINVLGTVDSATGDLAVGRGKFGGNPVDYLQGNADDVRVFDRAVTADEAAQLYAEGRP